MLLRIQDAVKNMSGQPKEGENFETDNTWLDSIIQFPIYIWEREPMELGEGGVVINDQGMLQKPYGESDEIDYDEQELLEAFVDCLNEITAY